MSNKFFITNRVRRFEHGSKDILNVRRNLLVFENAQGFQVGERSIAQSHVRERKKESAASFRAHACKGPIRTKRRR